MEITKSMQEIVCCHVIRPTAGRKEFRCSIQGIQHRVNRNRNVEVAGSHDSGQSSENMRGNRVKKEISPLSLIRTDDNYALLIKVDNYGEGYRR